MRHVCGLMIVLSCLGWFACQIEIPSAANSQSLHTAWRRTVNGWEPQTIWSRGENVGDAPLHPAILAAAELLFCLLALAAIPSSAVTVPRPVS